MDSPRILFYDGGCGLCHRAVRFLLARDPEARIQFAPLGGETFARMASFLPPTLPDSLVLLEEGHLHLRYDAVLHLLTLLGGGWAALAMAGRCLPPILGDPVYDWVARRRTRGACLAPPLAMKDRFLP